MLIHPDASAAPFGELAQNFWAAATSSLRRASS